MSTKRMDEMCAEVVSALRRSGVDCLVLKGPAIAQWLYGDGERRTYHDIDVLVDPLALDRAAEVLLDLGFVPPAPAYTDDVPGHAQAWHRYEDGAWLDLHYTLTGVSVTPERLWASVWSSRQPLSVAGTEVVVLDEAARALHVALHVSQDRLGQGKKLEDMRRAIERLPHALWEKAAALAVDLGAGPAMGAGLRQLPEGAALAERLALPSPDRVDLVVRAETSAAGTDAFEWFTRRPGIRGKLRFALAKAFPPPWFLRAWTPVARRWGVLGLGIGYAVRLAWLARTTPPAAMAWWRARRRLRDTTRA